MRATKGCQIAVGNLSRDRRSAAARFAGDNGAASALSAATVCQLILFSVCLLKCQYAASVEWRNQTNGDRTLLYSFVPIDSLRRGSFLGRVLFDYCPAGCGDGGRDLSHASSGHS